MFPKSLFASRTFWFNLLVVILTFVMQNINQLPLDPTLMITVTAVINMILRYLTTRPVKALI